VRDLVAIDACGTDGGGPLAVAALEDELVGFFVLTRVKHVGAGAESQRCVV